MVDVEVVKVAIGHDAGWEAMAKTIKDSDNPKQSKVEYELALRSIAADPKVNVRELLNIPKGVMMIQVEMGDYLVNQLDSLLANLK